MVTHSHVIDVNDPKFLSSAFGYFALALLMTAGGAFLGFWMLANNPNLIVNPFILYGAIIAELVLVFTSHLWSRNLPFGYGMFMLFSLLSGFTLMPILLLAGATGGAAIIIKALISSVSVFAAAALYGWTTDRNLVGMGGFLMMTLFGLIVLGILGIFFPWSNTIELVVSGFTVVLFAGFTMVDIQRIQKTPGLNPLLAAMSLYLNFINIFTSILRFMMAMNNRR